LYRTGDLGRYLPDGNIEFLGREDNQVSCKATASNWEIEVTLSDILMSRQPSSLPSAKGQSRNILRRTLLPTTYRSPS
jgi:hypothetical protein